MPDTLNRLYYGDNLDVLRRYIDSESIDLVYLDPPFNSNANYNVLFAEKGGTRASAQIKAFEDTWQWDSSAAEAYAKTVERGGAVSQALQAFRTFLGESDMLAYLAMMAPRLVELRRVLKETGTLYLHCDPTAAHYLKMLLDAVFGPAMFVSEVAWKRTHSHGDSKRSFGSVLDVLLVYSKSNGYKWNDLMRPLDNDHVSAKFTNEDADGRRWQSVTLRSPNPRPNLHYPYTASNGKTYLPHPNGWSCDTERMRKYDLEHRLHFPKKPDGQLRLKMYLDESKGMRVQSLWDDIYPINSQAQERLGYPTQKPEALLERVISASSNEGDVVLDPFCGCGTTIAAAQKLKRRWIGIDITHLAIGLIKKRLSDAYGEAVKDTYEVIGEPVTVDDARDLAASDPFQFQTWALGLVGARPAGSEQVKKGKDRGIDGRVYFHDDTSGETKQIILSVKAGHTGPDHVRDLRGTVEREKAQIGVMITMEPTTKEMRKEAATGEFYASQWGPHPKIQILTVADLLAGKTINRPPDRQTGATFKRAPKAKPKEAEQSNFLGGSD